MQPRAEADAVIPAKDIALTAPGPVQRSGEWGLMGFRAYFRIEWRLLAFVFGTALVVLVLFGFGLPLWPNLLGREASQDWGVFFSIFGAAAVLRAAIPVLIVWMITVPISRWLRMSENHAALFASVPMTLVAWLTLVVTLIDFFGPRALSDAALTVLVFALVVIQLVALVMAHLLYRGGAKLTASDYPERA